MSAMNNKYKQTTRLDRTLADTANSSFLTRFFSDSSNLVVYAILSILCIIIYGNTLWNDYVLDDILVLSNNTLVTQGIKAIPKLFATTHMYGYLNIANDLYRPLPLVMFAIEYQFFGPNPAIGHFFNIVVFIGCVCLFFKFVCVFLPDTNKVVALVAALFFAVHPIHTEVVANIKSRDELLCFLFSFAALLQFIKYQQGNGLGNLLLGGLWLFLALLAKETAITMIGVIALLFFVRFAENKKRFAQQQQAQQQTQQQH